MHVCMCVCVFLVLDQPLGCSVVQKVREEMRAEHLAVQAKRRFPEAERRTALI